MKGYSNLPRVSGDVTALQKCLRYDQCPQIDATADPEIVSIAALQEGTDIAEGGEGVVYVRVPTQESHDRHTDIGLMGSRVGHLSYGHRHRCSALLWL